MAKKGKDCFLPAHLAPLHQRPKAYTADHKAVLHLRTCTQLSFSMLRKIGGIKR